VLDLAGVPFEEALRQTRRAAMTASKYAYCDPFQMEELIARLAEERGTPIDTNCFFNDRRNTPRSESVAAPSASVFRWTARQDDPFETLMVHVNDAADTVQLAVFVDTHAWSPRDAETLVRRMEEFVVDGVAGLPEGAGDTATASGIIAAPG
jgi:hypothetical protein